MILRATRLVLFVILITLSLGQFSRLPLPGLPADTVVYLNDLLLLILIVLWLTQKMVIEKRLQLPPLAGWIFLFVALAFLSWVNGLRYVTLSEGMVALFYLIRWIQYAFLYLVVVDPVVCQNGPKLKKKIIAWLLLGVGVFSTIGLVQFVLFPDFSKYVEHGWDPHYYRVLSTFFDPNYAGIFLTFGLILGLNTLLLQKQSRQPTLALFVYLAVVLTAIILTFSRSTYLAFLVGVGVVGLIKNRRLLLGLALTAALSFLFVPRVQTRVIGALHLDRTARFRLENWQKSLVIIRDHPWLGVGFNTFRYAQENYGYFRNERGVNQPSGLAGAGADSSLLFLWATTGIFGLATYMSLMFFTWQRAWSSFRQKTGWPQVVGLTLVAGLPAWLIHSQFVNSWFYPWMMEVFWIMVAFL